MNIKYTKTIICLILILAAVLSFTFVADKASSIETHNRRIAALDEKVETVLKLTAVSSVASAGISAIPGDTATPIAQKLADFTEYFLAILCVLYSEKYLLTILGLGTFRILIPVALLLIAAGLFWKPQFAQKLGIKLFVFGLAIYFAIPLGLKVSDMVYDTYKESISNTIEVTQQLSDETAQLAQANDDSGKLSQILETLKKTASGLVEDAANILRHFVETLAVLIVTSCIIPIIVVIFIIWVTKLLLGASIPDAVPLLESHREKHPHRE